MKKFRIGIVEDEVIIAHNIAALLQELGYDTCKPCGNYDDALLMIDTEKPDLVLLDIKLSDGSSGINVAQQLRDNYDIPYVFLTANSDKVTLEQAKLTRPNAFIVKPFQKTDLFAAIEIAIYNHEIEQARPMANLKVATDTATALFIKEGQYLHKVYVDDILYLSSDHVYVTVHTVDKNYLVRTSMQEYLSKLNAENFIRIHRSYVVNVNKIDKINSVYLILNGEQLPVSRNHRENLLEALNT